MSTLQTSGSISFSDIQTQFGGSNSHRTTKSSTFDLSYSESLNLAEYKNGVKSQAYYNLMHKSPLIFSATGLHFMDGLHNNTLGRKINLEFLPTDQFDIPEQKDRKFSGISILENLAPVNVMSYLSLFITC